MSRRDPPAGPPSGPLPSAGNTPWGQPSTTPPRRRRRWKGLLTHGAAAVVGLLLGVGIGAAGTEPDGKTPGRPAVTASPVERASSGNPRDQFAGDGTFLVGQDLRPGTYRSAGPADRGALSQCYWARLSNTSGDLAAVVANGIAHGPAVVTVGPADKAFDTKGCQAWKRIG
ncbi:hypothetical protein KPP03845_105714 [Streptomyces xanthophaeus]|uniref:hypothetical protein n=1 Tax=Streptomyces xanthophaeus TaxID=67385 RepID=UPI00233EA20A|nr:hypothetical protein [Streptomyces xanthophaeus]WCD89295.1 hypothetical protein KPP03845_105714 [Streptomyces xanthophaeus]